MPNDTDPMSEIHEQLEGMKKDVDNLRAETVGDRNKIETFKQTLRGRIEQLEHSAEKLVSKDDHDKLKDSVDGLSETVGQATGVLNNAVKTVIGAILTGFGLWLLNRIMGTG